MTKPVEMREHNKAAHEDMERDILDQKDGEYTCVLKVNNGNIVDYIYTSCETYAESNIDE